MGFDLMISLQGWQLVLTGHSLGAGVAALLALKLRPRFGFQNNLSAVQKLKYISGHLTVSCKAAGQD